MVRCSVVGGGGVRVRVSVYPPSHMSTMLAALSSHSMLFWGVVAIGAGLLAFVIGYVVSVVRMFFDTVRN